MIDIYTKLKKDADWVIKNDLYFNLHTANEPMSDADKAAIWEIDTAEVTDDNHIQTKYGIGTLRNLSSGCKTYLNVTKNPERVISAEECGGNVLEKLFQLDSIRIYMTRPERFAIAEDKEICFNDIDRVIGRSGYEEWWTAEYERRAEDDL